MRDVSIVIIINYFFALDSQQEWGMGEILKPGTVLVQSERSPGCSAVVEQSYAESDAIFMRNVDANGAEVLTDDLVRVSNYDDFFPKPRDLMSIPKPRD